MNELIKDLLSKDVWDFALTLGIIAVFIWVICLAAVFVIKATRSKKIFGAEFDPEKPHSDRRVK